MSSIPRVFRLVAVLAIMTAGLAIPSAAHAVGGSPQFPFCASSPVTTYGEFVYRDQWTWGPVRYVGSRALWASTTGLRGLGRGVDARRRQPCRIQRHLAPPVGIEHLLSLRQLSQGSDRREPGDIHALTPADLGKRDRRNAIGTLISTPVGATAAGLAGQGTVSAGHQPFPV